MLAGLGGNGIDNYQGGEVIHIQGDGGHAKVVRDIIGGMRWLQNALTQQAVPRKLAIVAVGDNRDRKAEAERLTAEGYEFIPLVHSRATVAPSPHLPADFALIGDGTVVMAGAVVQPSAKVGKHCILNTSCVVEHDCAIGDYAHIAPGAVLCGNVTVGEGALIGAGAVCVPGAVIPPWSLVKAGTVAK